MDKLKELISDEALTKAQGKPVELLSGFKCDNCAHLKWETLSRDEVGGGNVEMFCGKGRWRGNGDPLLRPTIDPWRHCEFYSETPVRQSPPPDQPVPEEVGWQKCPKCDGQGQVSKPPYLPGEISQWSGSTTCGFVCNVCNGAKIIASPSLSSTEAERDAIRQAFDEQSEELKKAREEVKRLTEQINSK